MSDEITLDSATEAVDALLKDDDTPTDAVEKEEAVEEGAADGKPLEEDTQDEDEEADGEEGEESTKEEEAKEEEDEEEEGESEEPAEVIHTLKDGTQLTADEVEKGYMRERDYTQKLQKHAEERKVLEEAQEVTLGIYQQGQQFADQLVKFMESVLPPAPALSLAQTDPTQYVSQKAVYDQAQAEFSAFLQSNQDALQHGQELANSRQAESMKAARSERDAALIATLDFLKTPDDIAAFDQKTLKAAAEFGFSAEEVNNTLDPRLFALMHYAALGKKAENNRTNAQQKPRVAKPTQKPKTPPISAKNTRTTGARQRFNKTQTVDDATVALAGLL